MVFDIVPNGPRRHPGCCCLRLRKPWEQCGRAGLWKREKVYSTGYFVSQTYPTRGCFRGRGCGRDESVLTRRITSNPVSRKAKANRNGWPTSTSHVTTTVLISTLLHADEEGPARQQKKTAAMGTTVEKDFSFHRFNIRTVVVVDGKISISLINCCDSTVSSILLYDGSCLRPFRGDGE